MLTIATGVSGIAHDLAPAVDVRWIYIVFVGIVAAIDSWVVGIGTAIVAVVAYEAMIYRELPFVFERDLFLFGGAVAATALARGARATFTPRAQLAASPPRLMLTATHVDTREVEDALRDALAQERSSRAMITAKLRDTERRIAELEQRSRELDRVRIEAGEAAATVAELERMNAELRLMINEQQPSIQEEVIEELSRELRELRSKSADDAVTIEQLRRHHEDAERDRDAIERELVESNDALASAREQLGSARAALDDQRVQLEAEWNEKLNTIVGHLASDHEADIGQAIMEREEARAEVRSLQMKVAQLTRDLEGRAAPAKKLLFVHRDAGMRAMTRHSLESSGYTVVTAGDGLEALRLAISEEPDLIVGEETMPKMAGRELAAFLKSRGETSAIKVVLLPLEEMADLQGLKSVIANALG